MLKFFQSACFLVFCSFFSSCSISERIVNEDREGEIPKSFFKQLKNKKSTKSWVAKNLGEPTYYEALENSTELASYRYSRGHYKSASALLLFNYNTVEHTTQYLHMVFKKGILKEYWTDNLGHVHPQKLKKYTKKNKRFFSKLFGGLFGSKSRQEQEPMHQSSNTNSVSMEAHVQQHHGQDKHHMEKLLKDKTEMKKDKMMTPKKMDKSMMHKNEEPVISEEPEMKKMSI